MKNMIDRKHQEYLELWEPEFRAKIYCFKNGPTDTRHWNDTCCHFVFGILVSAFLGLCIYTMSESPDMNVKSGEINTIFVISCCLIGGSLFFSLAYILSFYFFSSLTVYLSMAIVLAMLIAKTVLCFLYDGPAVAVIILIVLGVYILMIFCCYRQYIETTVLFVKTACILFKLRYRIFGVPVILSLVAILITLMWLITMYKISMTTGMPSQFGWLAVFLYIFLILFMFYTTSFIASMNAVAWYYRVDMDSWLKTTKMFVFHIGSLTFLSIGIFFFKLIVLLVNSSRKSHNTCKNIFMCMLRFCLSVAQGLVFTLNHQASILQVVTGQSLLKAAKTSAVLLYSHTKLFEVVDLVDRYLFWTGLCISAVLPTLLCVFLLSIWKVGDWALPLTFVYSMSSIMISVGNISILTQVIYSLFLFFCLDLKINSCGINGNPIDDELLDYYRRIFKGRDVEQFVTEQETPKPKDVFTARTITMPRLTMILPQDSQIDQEQATHKVVSRRVSKLISLSLE